MTCQADSQVLTSVSGSPVRDDPSEVGDVSLEVPVVAMSLYRPRQANSGVCLEIVLAASGTSGRSGRSYRYACLSGLANAWTPLALC